MDNKISDFINLNDKLDYLNIKLTSDFCILPENIETANSAAEFIFTHTHMTQAVKEKLSVPEYPG